jgi:hypothetical protein
MRLTRTALFVVSLALFPATLAAQQTGTGSTSSDSVTVNGQRGRALHDNTVASDRHFDPISGYGSGTNAGTPDTAGGIGAQSGASVPFDSPSRLYAHGKNKPR